MPRPLSERERQEFLAEVHVGVLSVSRDDGRPPLSTPVWYAYQPGGNVTFYTGTYTAKARLIQAARALSLTVQREALPYRYVCIEGSVVETTHPPAADQIFAVASRYLPHDAARELADSEASNRGHELILFTIRPDRWLTADFADDM